MFSDRRNRAGIRIETGFYLNNHSEVFLVPLSREIPCGSIPDSHTQSGSNITSVHAWNSIQTGLHRPIVLPTPQYTHISGYTLFTQA